MKSKPLAKYIMSTKAKLEMKEIEQIQQMLMK